MTNKFVISLFSCWLSFLIPSIGIAMMRHDLSIAAALTPGACRVSITSDIDYGKINTKNNAASGNPNYILPNKRIPFTITCVNPVNIAFSVKADSHPDSFARIMDPNYSAGLRDGHGTKAGYYSLHLFNNEIFVDGKSPYALSYSEDGGSNWSYAPSSLLKSDDTEWNSWSSDDGHILAAAKITGVLRLDAELYTDYMNHLTETTVVEGTTTFTLHYL